jgi:hypothetical protein
MNTVNFLEVSNDLDNLLIDYKHRFDRKLLKAQIQTLITSCRLEYPDLHTRNDTKSQAITRLIISLYSINHLLDARKSQEIYQKCKYEWHYIQGLISGANLGETK